MCKEKTKVLVIKIFYQVRICVKTINQILSSFIKDVPMHSNHQQWNLAYTHTYSIHTYFMIYMQCYPNALRQKTNDKDEEGNILYIFHAWKMTDMQKSSVWPQNVRKKHQHNNINNSNDDDDDVDNIQRTTTKYTKDNFFVVVVYSFFLSLIFACTHRIPKYAAWKSESIVFFFLFM